MNTRGLIAGLMTGLCVLIGTTGNIWGNEFAVSDLKGYGTGNVVDMELVNPAGFVSVTYAGEGKATVLGKFNFTAKLAVRWDTPMPNGSGGYCAPASGYATHNVPDNSSIVLNFTGIFCEANQMAYATDTKPHMPAPPFTYTGSFIVADGTGRFSGASGSGSITGSTDKNLKLTVIVNGKIVH